MYSSAEESMWRLTSADKGRGDSEASFRYSEKSETGLLSSGNGSLLLSTFSPAAAVDNSFLNVVHKGMMGTSCLRLVRFEAV